MPTHSTRNRRRRPRPLTDLQVLILMAVYYLRFANTPQVATALGGDLSRDHISHNLRDLANRGFIENHYQRRPKGGRLPSIHCVTQAGSKAVIPDGPAVDDLSGDLRKHPPAGSPRVAGHVPPDKSRRQHGLQARSFGLDLREAILREDEWVTVGMGAEVAFEPTAIVDGRRVRLHLQDATMYKHTGQDYRTLRKMYDLEKAHHRNPMPTGGVPGIRPDVVLCLQDGGQRHFVLIEWAHSQRPHDLAAKFDAYSLFALWGPKAIGASFSVIFASNNPAEAYALYGSRNLVLMSNHPRGDDDVWRWNRGPFLFCDRAAVPAYTLWRYDGDDSHLEAHETALQLPLDPFRTGFEPVIPIHLVQSLLGRLRNS